VRQLRRKLDVPDFHVDGKEMMLQFGCEDKPRLSVLGCTFVILGGTKNKSAWLVALSTSALHFLIKTAKLVILEHLH